MINKGGRRHLLRCHLVFSRLRCVSLLVIFAACFATLIEHAVILAAAKSSRSRTGSATDPVRGKSTREEQDERHEKQYRLLATRLTRVFSAKNAQVSENGRRRVAANKQNQAANFRRGASEAEGEAASVLAQIKQDHEGITSAARWEQTETDKRTRRTGGDHADGGTELRVLPQQPQGEEERTTGAVYSTIFTTKSPDEEPGSPGPAFQFLEARLGERLGAVEGGQEQHLEQDIDFALGSSHTQKVEHANSAPTSSGAGTETGSGLAWQQKVQRLEDVVSQLGDVVREQGETIRHLRKELATQQVFQNTTAARIGSAGAVNEIIEQNHIAWSLANMRKDFVVMLVLLVIGYVAVLIGLALPTKLVFFPPVLYLPAPDEDPVEDHVDRSEQQTADAGAVDALREQRQRPVRKFMLLPRSFATQDTLSSVCQFQDSSAGKIWTSCLIVYAVCALLSRYTMVAGLYPSWCSNPSWAAKDEAWSSTTLLSLSGMPAGEMLFRVLWLVLPCVVGLMLTAAVPSTSDDALLRATQQENTEQDGQVMPCSTEGDVNKMRETDLPRVQESVSDDAMQCYRVRNARWQRIIHVVCAPLAMAVLLSSF
ncbi:unnamed protein product [Amoebophrya sp. A120]|nr:unnamed protein product [Amoebophrya sp. A120]|eukprot:GSA120T00007868001.1